MPPPQPEAPASSLARKRGPAEAVLEHVGVGQDLIVPLANGEPTALLDAIEAEADQLSGVHVHQMHALHDRPYLHGAHQGRLDHVSYFLSPVTRGPYAKGHLELVPAHFSEVPLLMRRTATRPLVLAAASLPDRHGFFSLGTNADYVAGLLGKAPIFLEATGAMPRTLGRNQIHVTQILGWTQSERDLLEINPPAITDKDRQIAARVTAYIHDGDTIQAGIGAVPNAIMSMLGNHNDLGVHTELLSDGLVDLAERGVITSTQKTVNRGKIVTTFALGTRRVYDYIDENPAVEFWPVEYVNNPVIIGREENFVSVNASLEVDLLGQCASESIGSRMHSGSGGQSDFARGAMYSQGGRSFIVLHSTTSDGSRSRISPQLTPGAAVTTMKNTVDYVVTEYGVAELRGATLRERARRLVAIAHPDFRETVREEARAHGLL